jgi:hypothetical protein
VKWNWTMMFHAAVFGAAVMSLCVACYWGGYRDGYKAASERGLEFIHSLLLSPFRWGQGVPPPVPHGTNRGAQKGISSGSGNIESSTKNKN